MNSSDEFVRHALEMMSAWGNVRSRKMFGGHGVYRDDVFFALIADDTLYLKADEQTRGAFQAAGSAPFVYDGHGETITMSYWRAPDECLESPATMRDWCELAFGAALRARAAKSPVKARRSR